MHNKSFVFPQLVFARERRTVSILFTGVNSDKSSLDAKQSTELHVHICVCNGCGDWKKETSSSLIRHRFTS